MIVARSLLRARVLGAVSLWFSIGCGAVAIDPPAASDGGTSPSGTTAAGTTKPTDGAPGVCCPPSVGGCANIGGYRADGKCDGLGLCDGMCEQRIVDDEHGCKKMTYRTPPVTTTFAGTGSCDAPVFNGKPPSQDPDAQPPVTCAYPDVQNDRRCPSSYSYSYSGKQCPSVGIACSYPGAGDGMANGCFATAMLWCAAGPSTPMDAAVPSGPGAWIAAQ